jgi:hypothetical protein
MRGLAHVTTYGHDHMYMVTGVRGWVLFLDRVRPESSHQNIQSVQQTLYNALQSTIGS